MHRLPEQTFLPLPTSALPPGPLHWPFGCCQMCGEGSVHQTEVHGLVTAELLQDHLSISAGAEWKALRLGHLWRRDPGDHGHSRWANLSLIYSCCNSATLQLREMKSLLPGHTHQCQLCDLFVSEATAQVPAEMHPYQDPDPANMPPDTGYGCKMVDGVMHVYMTRSIMEKWAVHAHKSLCVLKDARFASGLTRSGHVLMLSTGAPSWTCHIRTFRTTSPTWTSWWPSLSMAQCKV